MKKQKVNLLLIVSLLLSANGINAQEAALSFTLQEAQEYAVKNSYQAKLAQKDVEKSERKVKETISTGLPQINGAVNYQQYVETPVQLIPAAAFGGPEGEYEEVFFGTEQQMGASITANQLIFNGSYFVGLQAAKVYLELSKNDQAASEIEIRNMVTQAYGNVLVAEKNAEILKKNKENLDKIYFETGELYSNGFVEEQDKEQIEFLLANTSNAYEQAIRQIDVSRNQLKFILGISIENTIELKDNLMALTTLSKSSEFVSKEFDINSHIDYKSVLTQERASQLLWKQQKSNYLPSLNAFYTYQQNSFANEFNFFSSDAKWFGSQLVGINLSVPIFSSFNKHHKVQQAKIDFEKVQIAKEQVAQQLQIQAENAKSQYLFAFHQYETMNKNLGLAERIYDKVKAKYDEGINSSLELTQANNQLLETQGNYINASFQLINAKVNLDKALNNY
ncbi:MAG: TolC family protein [Bacteroidetes bacterium]|nr:MAG: TolC family protein [Bacteroidota bacterium]MBL1144894.1 TolC family protein [Bacteroidota bacterium]MCB0802437.1 TolC family protein [Flavobacteriales bacterium]NOG57688.1 TolC family protein [Bacteroidota bacterium]